MAHILVVEDEKAIGDLITMNLGHSFRKSFSGKDAVSLLSNGKFDLILLDIMLLEIDGLEDLR